MPKRPKLPPLDFSQLSQRTPFYFSQPEVKQEDEPLEKKTKLKSDNTLLCIDFDGTMVKGSLYNFLDNAFVLKNTEQYLVNM